MKILQASFPSGAAGAEGTRLCHSHAYIWILCLYLPVEAVGKCALFPPWFLREAHWKGILGYLFLTQHQWWALAWPVNAPSSSTPSVSLLPGRECFLCHVFFSSLPTPPSSPLLSAFPGEVRRLPPVPPHPALSPLLPSSPFLGEARRQGLSLSL